MPNARNCPNGKLTLGQRRKRWPSVNPALVYGCVTEKMAGVKITTKWRHKDSQHSANTRRLPNLGPMLGHRLQRWTSIETRLGVHLIDLDFRHT